MHGLLTNHQFALQLVNATQFLTPDARAMVFAEVVMVTADLMRDDGINVRGAFRMILDDEGGHPADPDAVPTPTQARGRAVTFMDNTAGEGGSSDNSDYDDDDDDDFMPTTSTRKRGAGKKTGAREAQKKGIARTSTRKTTVTQTSTVEADTAAGAEAPQTPASAAPTTPAGAALAIEAPTTPTSTIPSVAAPRTPFTAGISIQQALNIAQSLAEEMCRYHELPNTLDEDDEEMADRLDADNQATGFVLGASPAKKLSRSSKPVNPVQAVRAVNILVGILDTTGLQTFQAIRSSLEAPGGATAALAARFLVVSELPDLPTVASKFFDGFGRLLGLEGNSNMPKAYRDFTTNVARFNVHNLYRAFKDAVNPEHAAYDQDLVRIMEEVTGPRRTADRAATFVRKYMAASTSAEYGQLTIELEKSTTIGELGAALGGKGIFCVLPPSAYTV